MKPLISFAAVAILATSTFGADKPNPWPQFRGINGSGVADDQKPPVEFGPDKNLKWKVPVPSGLSSPIVAGDKLVITAFENDKLYTIAYNSADGKVAWRAEAPAKTIEPYYKADGSPAAPTSATDGERIVSYFGSYGLICYDLAGKELWKFEIPMSPLPGDFGTGSSPIIADGLVILLRDESKEPRILAVDVATGSLRWETKRKSPASYSTPVVWETPAGKQVVAAGHARMMGYDLKSGEEKWSVAGTPTSCCASPVVADGTLLFAGWSPGGADDKENQMPTFEAVLKDSDTNKDGILSKEEADKTPFKDFFDGTDANKDGKVTRDEWDAVIKFMTEGSNIAFALKPGGTGDVTKTHMLWKKTRGLPYVASALAYRGQYVMIKDGGLVSAFDAKTGNDVFLLERAAAAGRYYSSPVAANGHIYFTSLDHGAVTVIKAGGSKPEVVARNPKLGERVGATPAIADDTLYIRSEKHLFAFAEGK